MKIFNYVSRTALTKQLQGFMSIVPPVGSVWMWEPLKPFARQMVVVTDVKWNGEEYWIECVYLNMLLTQIPVQASEKYWNDLSRWVEATVFVCASVEHM